MDLLCLDFMNSDVTDALGSGERTDRLRDEEWVTRFLARWTLGEPGGMGRASLATLHELRAAMWSVLEAQLADGELPDDALAAIDSSLGGPTLRRFLKSNRGSFTVDVEPSRHDWAFVASEIAVSFVELLRTHDLHRVKLCGNPDCKWVFLDESKNRSRRWCADSCGNLVKVRRFRQKKMS